MYTGITFSNVLVFVLKKFYRQFRSVWSADENNTDQASGGMANSNTVSKDQTTKEFK